MFHKTQFTQKRLVLNVHLDKTIILCEAIFCGSTLTWAFCSILEFEKKVSPFQPLKFEKNYFTWNIRLEIQEDTFK